MQHENAKATHKSKYVGSYKRLQGLLSTWAKGLFDSENRSAWHRKRVQERADSLKRSVAVLFSNPMMQHWCLDWPLR